VAADVNITAEIEPLVLEVIADLDVAIKTIVAIEVGLNATVSISAAEKQEIANLVAEIVGVRSRVVSAGPAFAHRDILLVGHRALAGAAREREGGVDQDAHLEARQGHRLAP
jgi:hypothetical protein